MSERVVVVGAGIVGIAAAHYLHEAGREVVVVDAGSVGGACSHGNCGYICPSHTLPLTEPAALRTGLKSLFDPDAPFRFRPALRPALWRWMWEFARRCNHTQMLAAARPLKAMLDSARAEYQSLMEAERFDCEWRQEGLLYVFHSQKAMGEFAEVDRMLGEELGLSAVRIEGDALPDFDPALKAGLAGAFHYPGDASVRPDLLNRQWSARLRERGVEFVEHCAVSGVRRANGRVSAIDTAQGPIEADRFVFATGAWSARLSGDLDCRIPVEPGKGYSITMPRPSVCPEHPMLFPEHMVGVSPFADGYRLGSMMEFVGFDDSIPERRVQLLKSSAEPYLVEPFVEPVTERWTGFRPMTWDSLPIVGRVPRLDNAYLATGHNMLGVSLAPASGRLLAELMLDRTPHLDPAAYAVERFG